MLLKSCATPPARRPTDSSFCACSSRASSWAFSCWALFCSEMSRLTPTMPPTRPSAPHRPEVVTSVHTVDPSLQGCSSSPRKAGNSPVAARAASDACSSRRAIAADSGVSTSSRDCAITSAAVYPRSLSTDGLT